MYDLPEDKKKKFKEIFGTTISEFEDKMVEKNTGIFSFDIISFDDFLIEQGYNQDDGSMAEFVTEKYGIEAKKLIEDILFFSIQKQNEKL